MWKVGNGARAKQREESNPARKAPAIKCALNILAELEDSKHSFSLDPDFLPSFFGPECAHMQGEIPLIPHFFFGENL